MSVNREAGAEGSQTINICTWNVNGIRAWIKKGGLSFIKTENPDIICLQEIKCSEPKLPKDFLTDIANYPYKILFPAKKEGYSGVAVFSKIKPLSVKFGLSSLNLPETIVDYNSPLWENQVSLKHLLSASTKHESNLFSDYYNEGRLIIIDYINFFLICVYVPNSGFELKTLTKRLNWDQLLIKTIRRLNKIKPVILCGDLNVAPQEIDLANPKIKPTAGWTIEERYNFFLLLNTNPQVNNLTKENTLLHPVQALHNTHEDVFIDIFRYLYPKTKTYTFWSYMNNARENNKGWRLDYFILSIKLIHHVKDIIIFTHLLKPDLCQSILSSDHCPCILYLTI